MTFPGCLGVGGCTYFSCGPGHMLSINRLTEARCPHLQGNRDPWGDNRPAFLSKLQCLSVASGTYPEGWGCSGMASCPHGGNRPTTDFFKTQNTFLMKTCLTHRDLVQLQRRAGTTAGSGTCRLSLPKPWIWKPSQALTERFGDHLPSHVEIHASFPTTATFRPCLPNRGTAKDLITSERALISWDQVSPLTSFSGPRRGCPGNSSPWKVCFPSIFSFLFGLYPASLSPPEMLTLRWVRSAGGCKPFLGGCVQPLP